MFSGRSEAEHEAAQQQAPERPKDDANMR